MCSSHYIRRARSYFVPRMGLKLAVHGEPCWGSHWSPPLRPVGFIEVHLETFGLSKDVLWKQWFMLLIEHLSPAAAQNSLLMRFFQYPISRFLQIDFSREQKWAFHQTRSRLIRQSTFRVFAQQYLVTAVAPYPAHCSIAALQRRLMPVASCCSSFPAGDSYSL